MSTRFADFSSALGEFASIAGTSAGGPTTPNYQIVAPGAPAFGAPPPGVTSQAWNAVLDAVRQFEGNPNYGYGCPDNCCNPATTDCRAVASNTLAQWYAKFGNLSQALNYYNTGKPDTGYGAQAVNAAQVLFAGAGGVGDELSRLGGLVVNPGGATGQSNAGAIGNAVSQSPLWQSLSKNTTTTIVVLIVGIILLGIAAQQISKG